MGYPLHKIGFVTDEFAVGKPVQQLLDRFLIGYPHDGVFRRIKDARISLYSPVSSADIETRVKDLGLVRNASLRDCVANADAIVIAETGIIPSPSTMNSVLETAKQGARIFVYGACNRAIAQTRHLLIAGTTLATTFWLPEFEVPRNLRRAAVVVQGPYPTAEVEGLDALLAITGQPTGATPVTVRAKRLEGESLWNYLEGEFGALIASALSRSDSPQGDALVDARTQDLFGQSLIRKLARNPRAWLITYQDGFQSLIAVLDGVVADYNFAVQTTGGRILSAQLYRPPSPAQHEFSRLAATIEEFFRSGISPWPTERTRLMADLLEQIQSQSAKEGA